MDYKQHGLLSLKSIPGNVKNILIEEDTSWYKENLHCLPDFFSQLTHLFYSDEVSASHVQVRSLVFDSGLLYPIFDQTGNLGASRLFLQEMLRETQYSQEKIECSSTIQAETANCGEKWIATGNALLTSRRGQKGLLSVRIEEVYDDYENYLLTSLSRKAQEFGGWNWKPTFYESCLIAIQEETRAEKMEDVLVVSVYFWTDRTEFIKATDPYYQIRSDGTRGAEMSSFK